MFSYTVKVYPLATPAGAGEWKFVASADLIIADKLVIKGFKVMANSKGDLFAGAPSQKDPGGKKNDQGKDIYWDQVKFIDPKDAEEDKQTPLQKEILDAVIAEYRQTIKGGSTSAATPTPATTSVGPAAPAKKKSPLWG